MQRASLPAWAERLITLYESHAASQFILYGNVSDRFVLPLAEQSLGSLYDFLRKVMMPGLDIVFSYDLGNGIRLDKGAELFSQWPGLKESADLPRSPRGAIELLTRFFRYSANLQRLGQQSYRIGFYMRAAHLVVPALPGALNYDLNALALLIRDWASDDQLATHPLVTFLIADNLNDIHPLVVSDPRTAAVEIPLPAPAELGAALALLAPSFAAVLAPFHERLPELAEQLAGATLGSIEKVLRVKRHQREELAHADLVQLKKALVEQGADGLIEFIESRRTLDDVYAQDELKAWLRQDIALWRAGDLQALPMGYLICGPVGTGKTYLVECLAGEAGMPVVKLKNFRDKWVGSTEGNLEKIFRLLKGLGRCLVFIDEADQALGKRDAGANDAGLSGRVYGMFAQQMSDTENRGKIAWVLASSRPDLIEVDLKRPGRVDVKIPIFPSTTAREGFALVRALCKRRGVEIAEADFGELESVMPDLLTPGAAESIAVKAYRSVKTRALAPLAALRDVLDGYQNPVPLDILNAQITLAAREASDGQFVPARFRHLRD
jgi:ATPase family protein associated with various cellular activities (AAA)